MPYYVGSAVHALISMPSAYGLYFDGSNYHINAFATGADVYASASAATIAANLGTLLNGSTQASPITVWIDPSVSLAGQSWATYGSGFALYGFGNPFQNNTHPGSPNIGSFALGVNGQTANMAGIRFQNIVFEGEAFNDYGLISDVNHHDCAYAGVNAGATIPINNVGGGGIQYLGWSGKTRIFPKINNDFWYINGLGSTSSLGHIHIDHLVCSGGTTDTNLNIFHFANGTKWSRVYVGNADIEIATGAFTFNVLQFDGGASVNDTICPGIRINHLSAEIHSTGPNYVVQNGNFTAGHLNATIVIDDLANDVPGIALYNNQGGVFNQFGLFLEVARIRSNNSNSSKATLGTWAEGTTNPIRIGPTFGQTVPLNSGDIISTPVSGTVLSVGGTGAFVASTTYTCGGTRLGVKSTGGTVTITDATGAALITAVTPGAGVTYYLLPGMQFLGTGTVVFWKAE